MSTNPVDDCHLSTTFDPGPLVRVSNGLWDNVIALEKRWFDSPVEQSCAIMRQRENGIWQLGFNEVGTRHAVLFATKSIFQHLLERDCDALILSHYHPDGGTQPSRQDIHVTRSIAYACELIDVELVDHIIFGTGPPYSFRGDRRL